MGIYIKGMEMPTFCERCPMYSEDYWSCNAIPREFPDSFYPWYDDRPDWCPLVEVPPHGDLIDISEADFSYYIPDAGYLSEYQKGWNCGMEQIANSIKVIIKAEEDT